MPRKPNSVLAALEAFREVHPGISLGQMIAFLYAAENEGITLADLAEVTGFYLATASRTIRSFAPAAYAGAMFPALGFVEIRSTRRGKALFLTPEGVAFVAHLNRIIGASVAIEPRATPERPAQIAARAGTAEAPRPAPPSGPTRG